MTYNVITFICEYNYIIFENFIAQMDMPANVQRPGNLTELEPVSGRYAGMEGWMSRMVRSRVLRKPDLAT
jgi:hypothetical protein